MVLIHANNPPLKILILHDSASPFSCQSGAECVKNRLSLHACKASSSRSPPYMYLHNLLNTRKPHSHLLAPACKRLCTLPLALSVSLSLSRESPMPTFFKKNNVLTWQGLACISLVFTAAQTSRQNARSIQIEIGFANLTP